MPAGSTMTYCECPTSPLHQPGEHSARPKQKPRRRDGALVIKRACLEGVAGTAAGPPPQRRAAELHRLPPQRVQLPRGPFAWRGWACRHEHPDQGRRTELPFAQTGTIRGLAVFS